MFPKRHNRLDRFVTIGWVVLVIGLSVACYVALKPIPSVYTPGGSVAVHQADADMNDGTTAEPPDFSVIWAGEPNLTRSASSDGASKAALSSGSGAVNFQLRGVFYDASGLTMAALALNGKQALYGVGDVISEWEISEIDALSITVVRNGKRRTLRMAMPAYAYVPSGSISERAASEEAATVWNQSAPGPGSGLETLRQKRLSATSTRPKARPNLADREDVEATVAVASSIFDRLREDPTSVKFGVGFTPNLDPSGSMQGVLLNTVEPGSLAAQYGLAPGDRILAVNGQSIASLTGAMQLYQRYRSSDSVRVTIERGGLVRNVLFYAR